MGVGFGLVWFNRKIRLTQLWVELSWVVANILYCSKLLAVKRLGPIYGQYAPWGVIIEETQLGGVSIWCRRITTILPLSLFSSSVMTFLQ